MKTEKNGRPLRHPRVALRDITQMLERTGIIGVRSFKIVAFTDKSRVTLEFNNRNLEPESIKHIRREWQQENAFDKRIGLLRETDDRKKAKTASAFKKCPNCIGVMARNQAMTLWVCGTCGTTQHT